MFKTVVLIWTVWSSAKANILCWPDTSFVLLKSSTGCSSIPECGVTFADGYYQYDTENTDNQNDFSRNGHFQHPVSRDIIRLDFCTKSAVNSSINNVDWPKGCYCIFEKDNGCPKEFREGKTRWYTETDQERTGNSMSGEVSDGIFNDSFIELHFCCRCDGYHNSEMILPKTQGFYLMAHYLAGNSCQLVEGMDVQPEYIQWHTDNSENNNTFTTPVPTGADSTRSLPFIIFCYYSPVDESPATTTFPLATQASLAGYISLSVVTTITAIGLFAVLAIMAFVICRKIYHHRKKKKSGFAETQSNAGRPYETMSRIPRGFSTRSNTALPSRFFLQGSTEWMRERTNTERTYEVPISSFPRSGLNSVNKSVSYSEHLQESTHLCTIEEQDMMADNTDVSFHPDGEDHAIYMNAPTCLPYNPPPSESNSALYEFIGRMMLPATITSSDIIIGEVIGSGHFGEVHKAVWRKDGGHVHVAVKMQNDGVEEKDKITFLREAAIMGQFDHNHVVKLFGVVSESSANGLWDTIVMELLPNGSLHSYLPNALYGVTQETAASTLLGFSRDVASGMEYLSSKKFIHRDLAARNVLLDAHLACKIADFGMAHDIDDSYYYKSKGGLVPLKWTAPEALAYRKYSTSSDVWSYGCVLYEIWSLGKKPLDNLNVHEIFYQLIIGYRQPPPPGCPRAIYQLMIKSWNPTPGERPTFASIHRTLVQPKEIVLKWSFKDHNIEKDAVTLGASLESGKLLYTELQNKYFVDDEQSSP